MGKGKKMGDRTDLLTKDEMHKLFLVVSDNLYFNTLYNLLLHTGRRIGEIYGTQRGKNYFGGIKVKDVDLINKTLRTIILKTKKRKLRVLCGSCKLETTYKNDFCPNCGDKLPQIDKDKLKYDEVEEKIITLKDNLIILLDKYIKQNKLNQSQYLFREYSLVYLKKKIKQHIIQASVKKNFSLHGFRHYFITQCKIAGMSNEDIAKWTGHKNLETLTHYDRRVSKDVENKILNVEL